MASLFDKLYAASEEVMKGMKKPLVKNKVQRALDGAADSLEGQKIDIQESIDKAMASLAQGNTEAITGLIDARRDLAEVEIQITEAKMLKDILFAKEEI